MAGPVFLLELMLQVIQKDVVALILQRSLDFLEVPLDKLKHLLQLVLFSVLVVILINKLKEFLATVRLV